MQNAINAARAATRRRSSAVMPRVTDRKIGASPGGSTVTRSVTSAEARKSAYIKGNVTGFRRRQKNGPEAQVPLRAIDQGSWRREASGPIGSGLRGRNSD